MNVIQNCDLLGGELPNVLKGCKTLEDLEAQITGHVNKRSDTKVDAELRKKVKAMAAQEGPAFAEACGKISVCAKLVASKNLVYQGATDADFHGGVVRNHITASLDKFQLL